MSSLYTEIITDAYRYPRHRGGLPDATHSHEEDNPLCGDQLRVHLRVQEGVVTEAKFEGQGCAISQAAAELILEGIQGQPVSAVREITKDTVLEELGLPSISPARLKCALLCLSALRGALDLNPGNVPQ
ncbi:MAG: iron-sulfur cluster assembly scaffold protein [Chloroflexota bacterium]|nr:MAG: Fe-S cluster protein [Chloroflexota bacterium]